MAEYALVVRLPGIVGPAGSLSSEDAALVQAGIDAADQIATDKTEILGDVAAVEARAAALEVKIEYDTSDTRPGVHFRLPNGKSIAFLSDDVLISRPFQREQQRITAIDRKVAEDAADPRPGVRPLYPNGKAPFVIGSRRVLHPDTNDMRSRLAAAEATIERLRLAGVTTLPIVPRARYLCADKYGQSLSVSVESTYLSTPSITTELLYAWMWQAERLRDGGLIPDPSFYSALQRLAGAVVSQGSVDYGEGSWACAELLQRILLEQHATRFVEDLNLGLVFQAAGEGSKTIAQLGPDSDYFARLIDGHEAGYGLYGKLFVPAHLHLIQGEDDQENGTSAANWKTGAEAVRAAIAAHRTANGITTPYYASLTQFCSHLTNGATTRPTIALAQLDLARTNALWTLSTPLQHIPYADPQHATTDGYHWIDGYRALDFYRWVFLGEKPAFLDPQTAIRDGRHLIIPISGVHGALVWDTATVPAHPGGTFGFQLCESNATDAAEIEIETPEILGGRHVRLSRPSGDVSAGNEWRYAFLGAEGGSRSWGNLRDRQGDRYSVYPDGRALRLDKWLPISAEVVS